MELLDPSYSHEIYTLLGFSGPFLSDAQPTGKTLEQKVWIISFTHK